MKIQNKYVDGVWKSQKKSQLSFNIVSEARYFYILSWQKSFEKLKLAVKQCYQTGHFRLNKNKKN